jgi:hypothetical protein
MLHSADGITTAKTLVVVRLIPVDQGNLPERASL